MGDNQTDYLGYITGGLGLIAVIIGFFSPSYQIVVFVGGIIGIGVSISWVKTSEYIERIKTTEKEIRDMKKEMDSFKKYNELKTEIEILKNKSGKVDDVFLVFLIIILVILILMGLGIVKPSSLP